MSPQIKPIFPNVKVVGPAFTVKISANDSTLLHKTMGLVEPGDVVVVDRMGDTVHACTGEVVVLAAKLKGVAGIIVDGPATDVKEITEMGVPVFATGLSAVTTKLVGLDGEINTTIQCGGATVNPGDLIFADDNGVLVIAPKDAERLLEMAEISEEKEVGIKEKLYNGHLLPDLSGADRLIQGELPKIIKELRQKKTK